MEQWGEGKAGTTTLPIAYSNTSYSIVADTTLSGSGNYPSRTKNSFIAREGGAWGSDAYFTFRYATFGF